MFMYVSVVTHFYDRVVSHSMGFIFCLYSSACSHFISIMNNASMNIHKSFVNIHFYFPLVDTSFLFFFFFLETFIYLFIYLNFILFLNFT